MTSRNPNNQLWPLCIARQRAAFWAFTRVDTLRTTLLHRAGRLTRPKGMLTLSINHQAQLREELPRLLALLAA